MPIWNAPTISKHTLTPQVPDGLTPRLRSFSVLPATAVACHNARPPRHEEPAHYGRKAKASPS